MTQITKKQSAMPYNSYEPFLYPAYRRYVLGVNVVKISVAIQGVAIAWEIYVRTDDVLALGMVGLVQAIPMLIFPLPGGYLADVGPEGPWCCCTTWQVHHPNRHTFQANCKTVASTRVH